MSVDAQRLMDVCTYSHVGKLNTTIQNIWSWHYYKAWSGPFQIVIALFFLYNTMGVSVGAGVAVLLLAIPLNTLIARKMRTYQKTQMSNKDARVKLMVNILFLVFVYVFKSYILILERNFEWYPCY